MPFKNLYRSPSALPRIEAVDARADWVDIAKGISITLLVAWHMIEDKIALNESLIFLRMPLFFFVAGLFLRGVFLDTTGMKFRARTTNMIYLYILWSVILFLPFLANDVIRHHKADLSPMLYMFVEPPRTVWFIYALAISITVVMLARRLPVWVLLAASISLYLFSVWHVDTWRTIPFYHKVIRLLPFMIVGIACYEKLDAVTERFAKYWPLVLPPFIAASYYVYFSDLHRIGALTFPLSICGIAGVMLFSRYISQFRFSGMLTYLGYGSLYIYLLHRIFLMAHEMIRRVLFGPDANPHLLSAFYVVSVVACVYSCAWVGRTLSKHRYFKYLFSIPNMKRFPWPKGFTRSSAQS